MFTHPVGQVEKQITPKRNVILEPTKPLDRLSGRKDRNANQLQQRENQSSAKETAQDAAQ